MLGAHVARRRRKKKRSYRRKQLREYDRHILEERKREREEYEAFMQELERSLARIDDALRGVKG